jgi:hypothetical protein
MHIHSTVTPLQPLKEQTDQLPLEGRAMIRILEYDRRLADVELIDGKLHVISHDGDYVAEVLEDMRYYEGRRLTDKELYESLPIRMTGRTWAGYVKV